MPKKPAEGLLVSLIVGPEEEESKWEAWECPRFWSYW